MHQFTEEKIFSVLYNTIRFAYIEEREHYYELGYESEITFAECMYYWEEEELPKLMDKYAVQYYDGGSFTKGYNEATIRIDGYAFDLEHIFYEVVKDIEG